VKRKLVGRQTMEGTPRPAALKAAGLDSSSYYYRPTLIRKPRALDADLVSLNQVRRGHGEVYGYRKITRALQAMES
jgi:hypothetical protein